MRKRIAAFVAAVIATMLQLAGGMSAAVASQADGREVLLVLDTSSSMKADDLASARDAALDFVSAVPGDVRVGLITFSTKPRLVVSPTIEANEVVDGLDGVKPGGGTALYEAIELGVSTLREVASAEDRLVVLSDGGNTEGKSSVQDVAGLLTDNGVVADFVAYHYGGKDTAAMKRLAKASGGRVLTAENADQLAEAFKAIARSAPASAAEPEESGWLSWWPNLSWQVWTLGGVTFGAVLVGVLAAFGIGRRQDDKKRVLAQIAQYGRQRQPVAEKQQAGSIAQTAVGWTEGVLRARGWEEKLAERLDLAAIKLKPAEWTVLQVCAGVAVAALTIALGLNFFIGIAVGLAVGGVVTELVMRMRISRRRRAFADQLPDVLQLIAGSLQSGFSLAQALDSVVRDDTQPAAGEFSRALAESRIGVELEDTLERVAYRMASDDLRWVVMAIRIQREVGGNLAEILLTTVGTMRERAQLRRHVRALSAEGRLSAYILLVLPFALGGFILWQNPDYMRPLYTTTVGIVMIVGSAVFMALGAFWMRQLVKVEV